MMDLNETTKRGRKINKIHSNPSYNQNASEEANTSSGVVIANFGNQVLVQDVNNFHYRCPQRNAISQLVTGDKVLIREDESTVDCDLTARVVAKLPRKNELSRPNAQKKLCPIAANIDFILIVVACAPTPQPELIDRYVVASEASGITPILVLNKSDLLEEDKELKESISDLLTIYEKLDYVIVNTSAKQHRIKNLKGFLKDKTSVLVGQSGVGKSSLINELLSRNASKVGPLSKGINKGTHTTTVAQLFNMDMGGSIIDSPGIREFDLWHISPKEVERSFREFSTYIDKCRFRDCRHRAEPNCAIKEAVRTGFISEMRLRSFHSITQQ